jgi:hypothetical protein
MVEEITEEEAEHMASNLVENISSLIQGKPKEVVDAALGMVIHNSKATILEAGQCGCCNKEKAIVKVVKTGLLLCKACALIKL